MQAPALTAITITSASEMIASGTAVQVYATGKYSDSPTLDLTTSYKLPQVRGGRALLGALEGIPH